MLHKNKEKSGGGKRGVTKKRLSLRNLRGATRGEWGHKKWREGNTTPDCAGEWTTIRRLEELIRRRDRKVLHQSGR